MISAFGMCRDESLKISLALCQQADQVEVFVSMVTREYTFSTETLALKLCSLWAIEHIQYFVCLWIVPDIPSQTSGKKTSFLVLQHI